ncbi:MAG TPA: hypothetical protein VHV47_15090 [Opitutaceae bacterium]|nr:hypothetical protein [Opitutaceae bacterium]
MNKTRLVRHFYVLPCCVLLLNLLVGIVSYKAQLIGDPLLRTAFIMAMVLFGGSLIGWAMAPGLGWLVDTLHRRSRRTGGALGEVGFLLLLGALVFWLYYRMYLIGPQAILPAGWRN